MRPPPPLTGHALSCPSPGMMCPRMGDNDLSQTQFQDLPNSTPPYLLTSPKISKVPKFSPQVKDRLCQIGHNFL